DHRADIFAAGIVLWEILANRRLFLGKTDMETVALVKKAEVPPLSKFNAQVTPEFEAILARALARDPKKRYTSAREFGEALANYLFAHNLKVTGYDLAGVYQRLFDPKATENLDSPEERISALIQEEILNLSMLGFAPVGSDASAPIDVSKLSIGGKARFDFSGFWANKGVPQSLGLDGKPAGQSQDAAASDLASVL